LIFKKRIILGTSLKLPCCFAQAKVFARCFFKVTVVS
jgi:hypothetical protein